MTESQSTAVTEHRHKPEKSAHTHDPIPVAELSAGEIVSLLPPDWPVSPDLYEFLASSPHFAVLQPCAKRRDGSPSTPIAVSLDRDFYHSLRAIGN